MSLAGQYLLLQLLIVLAVLVAVAAISLAESAAAFERTEGRRALSAAEALGNNPTVRELLPTAEPRAGSALPAVAESVRTVSGSGQVALAKLDGTVVTASDPGLVGKILPLGDSRVKEGRAWTGVLAGSTGPVLSAHVPVLDDSGEMIGIASISRNYPSTLERLGDAAPNLLTYLGVASILGVAGSLLLSRRVKRQTLGMEPREITGLVENREAMLQGLKEGVVALDPHGRITVANQSARQLLGLPDDCVGQRLASLPVDPALKVVLARDQADPDQLVLVGDRLVVMNRVALTSRGRDMGSVTTLRDRTEMSSLERELGATRTVTNTLRAQAHEFANQLHVISGLLQLEEYESVIQFVNGATVDRTRLNDEVTSRIQDPALAALLIAKSSLATERGVELQLDPGSALPRVAEELSRDLTTVVGNLVDNAFDAVTGLPGATVSVLVVESGDEVRVTVRDNGPGIPDGDAEQIFSQGFSTKEPGPGDSRGFGLAISRVICRRSGGDLSVSNHNGAVFAARFMKEAVRP
ncbi:sensor histidine kinase [Paenarthrobacter ureafaciens]|jgi:sensor histidine kinase regulating citrate/malate metabolism|uniref:sensor histidine kinase n=1 Tax=Paenarthrobacter ureafaciens TaxID=37931 RepID=UPI00140DEF85|nr:sensor histidine kinase [Paenarthrobacter ureafaciens]MCX8454755.1 sensor histidine kinase [Paenarthrobacter ureafaciens]MCY0973561.1 sensor histidine kinase [Paenarthrobacter ureafaciens]UOD81898.1 sensor histidine kinase [Paenarthrobacter ureafaciens]WNZ05389.1 sensor histidine kinase [Paenarthrobacter ureafaciens]